MALNQNLQIRLGMRKNTNVKSTGYNKYYAAIAYRNGGLTQRGFIDHVAEHCISVPRAQVSAVITQLSECIPELISQGVSVKLDGIGIFYPTVASKGAAKPEDFNTNTDIKGVRMRFRPDGTKLDDLTSEAFMDKFSELTVPYVWATVTTRTNAQGQTEDVKGWLKWNLWANPEP